MKKSDEESFANNKLTHSKKEISDTKLSNFEDIKSNSERTLDDDMSDYIFVQPSRRRSGKGHRSSRKRGGKRRVKKVLIAIVCTLLAINLLFIGTIFILVNKGKGELYDQEIHIISPENVEAQVQDEGQHIIYNGETYEFNKNITSMLFMGVDRRDIDENVTTGTGGQADVIVLMAIDSQKGKTTMVSIPRDTVTDIAVYSIGGMYTGMEQAQLCLAYAYGDGKEKSCQNVLSSVQRIFYNIPIKSYFALDLDGIAAMNDAVGGVDVTSPETIDYFVDGESYHLEGSQAEKFVRARSHDRIDANLLRMERQKVYATAYMNKIIAETKNDITTPVDIFNASSPYSCTNLNPSKIAYLASEIVTGSGMDFEMKNIEGSLTQDENQYARFHIDEDALFELFLSIYYNKME